jgi:glycine dehydrogenase subunit 1
VDFNMAGKSVANINRALLEKGIFGGFDLSRDFPALGQSALYCVTEVTTKEEIDRLVDALRAIVEPTRS